MRQRRPLPARGARLLPGGELLGVDVAPEMVAAARALAGQQTHLRFEVGAGAALPAEDATYDAAFGERLLLHVADPVPVVAEMARVVKPGGRVVLMDWDFETVVVSHPDRELARRLLHWRCDHHSGDNWSGRRLLGYALAAGLRGVTVIPVVTVARDETAALTGSVFRGPRWRGTAAPLCPRNTMPGPSSCGGSLPRDGSWLASLTSLYGECERTVTERLRSVVR